MESQHSYYCKIDVILFLTKQNHYFRCHRKYFDAKKQGSVLESVELIANYNPVMNEHLSDIQVSKKRMLTYLL